MGVWDRLLTLLFPPKCAFCGRVLETADVLICPGCLSGLPRTGPKAAQRIEFLDTVLSPLYYEGDVRRSLLRYKFQGVPALVRAYGPLLAAAVSAEPSIRPTVAAWVPLSKKRLRKRGYDQARLLAEETARQLSLPCAPLLRKVRNAPPQSGAGSAEKRRANISGCYEALPGPISGERVLLIDDIVTTGATLSECARVLMLAGAERVYGGTLARRRD